MPTLMSDIKRLSKREQLQVMELLWECLSKDVSDEVPAWHQHELAETESRVEAGQEHFMSLEESKMRLRDIAYAG